MRIHSTTALTRRRSVAAVLVVVAIPGAAAVTGCGGSDAKGNDGDATALIDTAFDKSIKSSDLKLDAELKIQGLQGFDKPIRLQASGPYIASTTTVPKLDLDVSLGGAGQGQSLQTGFLSTGDRAFLKFGGEFYEQPQATVTAANKQLRQDKGSKQNALGIDPKSWLRGAKMQDDATIDGVKSSHVSVKVDVRSMLKDLNSVARKGSTALGGATAPKPLDQKRLNEAADTIRSPTFDVYVGKDDGLVHRVSGNLALSVPKKDRAQASGISGGSLRFTLDLSKPNGGQTVKAPATSRPISELSTQLGGAAALGGLAGGAGGSATTPATPPTTTPDPAGGSTATPSSESFKRYADCLDKAKPEDTQALTRCRSELKD